ncbi:MAG: Hsp70 family protein, partial [Planctomycetota bacterium]
MPSPAQRTESPRPTPVGIDFGTTTSLVAVLGRDGEVTVTPNRHGECSTPSVLFFGDQILVGADAAARASDESGEYVEAYKRDIGLPHFHRQINDHGAPPEVLAGFTLAQLRHDAEQAIGRLGKAIITVPAYYDERRRHATIAAGKLAGLDVADLINEPTAAALAHLYENREAGATPVSFSLPDKRLLVYDLGGGT